MDLLISKDGSFLAMNNTIVNLTNNKSFNIENINLDESIDFFKKQSLNILKSDKTKIFEINSFIRNFGYHLSEHLIFDDNKNFIFEFELKLNDSLLTEDIQNIYVLTEQVWDWVKNKASKAWQTTKSGVKYVGDKLSDVGKYLWSKGLPWFFDRLRTFLYSPVGIGLDVALTVGIPGGGKIAMMVIWGALLLWEIKELIEKGINLETGLNVLFASIGLLVPALSKSTKVALGSVAGTTILSKTSRGLIAKLLEIGGKSISKIVSLVGKGAEWLSRLFGSSVKSWVSKSINSMSSMLSKTFNYIENFITKGGNLSTKTAAMGISKGIKAGFIFFVIDSAIKKILHKKENEVKPEDKKVILDAISQQNPELLPITEFDYIPNPPDYPKIKINGKFYKMMLEHENLGKLVPYDTKITSTYPKQTNKIPNELLNTDGVKKFQNWLDINYPGWHSKYKTLNKNLEHGYGVYGSRTDKAWNTYKNEFLNLKSDNLANNEISKEDLEFLEKSLG